MQEGMSPLLCVVLSLSLSFVGWGVLCVSRVFQSRPIVGTRSRQEGGFCPGERGRFWGQEGWGWRAPRRGGPAFYCMGGWGGGRVGVGVLVVMPGATGGDVM